MGVLFGGRETRSAFPEPPVPPYLGANVWSNSPSGSGSGVARDPNQALAVPAVWACVGLLSNAVSMLPLETFVRSTTGVPRRTDDSALLTAPAAGMTQSEWLHMVMVSLLLRGNCYGLVVARDAELRPTQIELLNPDKVKVIVTDAGQVRYEVGIDQRDRAADIWHVRALTLPGSKVGLSPIAYAAATLGVDLSSRAFAAGFFSDGAHPSSILSTDQPVTREQAVTVKERFLAAVRGREPAVLGAGVKYTAIQVSPEESQFLETQKANIAQVARYFWIPPEMVGGESGGSMTYANVEQRSLDFLTYAVSFWLKRIEDAVTAVLPPQVYVRFDTAALLRTDAETQARVDVTLIAGKIEVPSEVRYRRNLPPMTEAQKAEADMVPLTVGPTGAAKPLPPAPPTAAPAAAQEGQTADA